MIITASSMVGWFGAMMMPPSLRNRSSSDRSRLTLPLLASTAMKVRAAPVTMPGPMDWLAFRGRTAWRTEPIRLQVPVTTAKLSRAR